MVAKAEELVRSYFGPPENLIGSPSFRITSIIRGDDTTFEVNFREPAKVFYKVTNAL